jgi:hypothetical protein
MYWRISALLIFILQVYLTFRGAKHLGKYFSPLVLFLLGISIAWIWWRNLKRVAPGSEPAADAEAAPLREKGILGAFFGMFGIMAVYEIVRKSFAQYTPPGNYSDVLPQLETMYHRFAAGEFPYAPVDVGTHIAYPVYLPLHWLPVGLMSDGRWVGFIALLLAVGLMCYHLFRMKSPLWQKMIAALLPAWILYCYSKWGEIDLPVSFEMIIAAYYLLLGIGLGTKNRILIAAGLITCLLSRYTLVFWLPLFALMYWQREGKKYSLWLWGSVAAAVLLIYVMPFWMQSPEILGKGLQYHNEAAVNEWKGYGEPPVSWSMERGIHFALHLKQISGGGAENQVFIARIIQAAIMLLLLALGLGLYRRIRTGINPYDLGLMMLYLTVLCFYAFGPLTYRYYMIVPLMLSALLTARIFVSRQATGSSIQ